MVDPNTVDLIFSTQFDSTAPQLTINGRRSIRIWHSFLSRIDIPLAFAVQTTGGTIGSVGLSLTDSTVVDNSGWGPAAAIYEQVFDSKGGSALGVVDLLVQNDPVPRQHC